MRSIRFSDWITSDDEPTRQRERLRAAFGAYRRERPRDTDEARLLRERGTPEHLIGPAR
jgi:hypothetical protein